jgi:NTP pyrophosphatase (non-canonical NTP hydrolase)
MDIENLVNESHKTAEDKGFWEERRAIVDAMSQSGLFSKSQIDYVLNAFTAQLLMLIVSEVGECMESYRNGKTVDKLSAGVINILSREKDGKIFDSLFEIFVKDTAEDEIADVFIRLGDFCGGKNIDIKRAIDLKMRYNKNREIKHGKKY